ncbi:MAG: flavodoxin family protein [Pseudomonadales bacterium]|jgi:multimeric flavodoxin WrbA|tara:strand:- start:11652 stop:12119 length:468 start_codon:yes stop_codon:yes gene_type:complete
MTTKQHLLIIYHSKDGSTGKMAAAVEQGASHPDMDIELKLILARDAGLEELLWADALILGTPENFGYMSGAMKDFFDRVFYPAEGKVEGLAFAMFVSAGNDGTGALSSIRRICQGFPFKEVQEPVVSQGDITADTLESCVQLGMYMAAGVESKLF